MADLRKAALLGTSTEVVRKRAARGSLRSERHDGRVVVWVDDGRTEGGREDEVDGGPLVEVLTDQVAYLRSQLDQEREARRRADTIIAQLTQANAALAQRVMCASIYSSSPVSRRSISLPDMAATQNSVPRAFSMSSRFFSTHSRRRASGSPQVSSSSSSV